MFAYELNTLPFEQQGILPWMKNWVAFSPGDEKVRVKVTRKTYEHWILLVHETRESRLQALISSNCYLCMKKWEWRLQQKLTIIKLLLVHVVQWKRWRGRLWTPGRDVLAPPARRKEWGSRLWLSPDWDFMMIFDDDDYEEKKLWQQLTPRPPQLEHPCWLQSPCVLPQPRVVRSSVLSPPNDIYSEYSSSWFI